MIFLLIINSPTRHWLAHFNGSFLVMGFMSIEFANKLPIDSFINFMDFWPKPQKGLYPAIMLMNIKLSCDRCKVALFSDSARRDDKKARLQVPVEMFYFLFSGRHMQPVVPFQRFRYHSYITGKERVVAFNSNSNRQFSSLLIWIPCRVQIIQPVASARETWYVPTMVRLVHLIGCSSIIIFLIVWSTLSLFFLISC